MWAKSGAGGGSGILRDNHSKSQSTDIYFSADVETDGPIPGPYSMLSFALVVAGRFDGRCFTRPSSYDDTFYVQLKPISENFEPEALAVNGIDREALHTTGREPTDAMRLAADWITARCDGGLPVLVAYPLSFDWSWLYWYFINFTGQSPFKHSRCFDIKTALATKRKLPIADAGRSGLPPHLRSSRAHTHHAIDDAIEQAEIFANVFEYQGNTTE